MNAWLLLLFDSDVHSRLEIELWVFGGLFAVIAWLARDLIRGVRTGVGEAKAGIDDTNKEVTKQTRRIDRHETEIVDKLREGNPFPPLD